MGYFLDCVSEDGRIADMIFCNVCVFPTLVLLVRCPYPVLEDCSEDNYREDDSHYAERIAYCTRECHLVAAIDVARVDLQQGLLSGSQHWSIGHGSAEKSHHVCHPDSCQRHHRYGHDRADDKHRRGKDVQLDPSSLEGSEKSRTDLDSKGIDIQHKPEILGKQQHVLVDADSEVSCQYACEEHESDSEGDSPDLDFSQGKTCSTNDAYYQYGLGESLVGEYAVVPFHIRVSLAETNTGRILRVLRTIL